jgi:hypothetical protein
LVEFRVPQRWDAGIGQAVVLIHDYTGDYSQIYRASSGRQGLIAGDIYEIGDSSPVGIGGFMSISISSIDVQALTATIGVTVRKDRRPGPMGPSRILFGGASGGVGIAISPNGGVVHIEPHLPLIRVLDAVIGLQNSESIVAGALRDQVRREALTALRGEVDAQLERLDGFRSPAPVSGQETVWTGLVEPSEVGPVHD